MECFQVLSFSHKTLPVSYIGKISFSNNEGLENILVESKKILGCKEIFCLSTCNRSEWIFYGPLLEHEEDTLNKLLGKLFRLNDEEISFLIKNRILKKGEEAILHVMRLSSSLESMVIGEREILAQVRKAYDFASDRGFISDKMRILMRFATACAKEVYSETRIAEKPVSVASLAYRELVKYLAGGKHVFLVIGAGETNWNLLDYLKKENGHQYYIYNRSLEKAKSLAERVQGQAFELKHLCRHRDTFDAILLCTSSREYILTPDIAELLFPLFRKHPLLVDLSVPSGIDPEINRKYQPTIIHIDTLKKQVEENRKEREKEISCCESIIRKHLSLHRKAQMERSIELLFGEIPKRIKETKEKAIHEVFEKEISSLDESSKEVLLKVVDYMEKKYNTFTFRSAKNLLLREDFFPHAS